MQGFSKSFRVVSSDDGRHCSPDSGLGMIVICPDWLLQGGPQQTSDTSRKINISPKKGPFQKENSFPTFILQADLLVSGGVNHKMILVRRCINGIYCQLSDYMLPTTCLQKHEESIE